MVTGSERVHSLPVVNWPEPDRESWANACHPGERLTRGGGAAHLKPITQADLQRRYGYFLDSLTRRDVPLTCRTAAELVSEDYVAAFVAELQGRVGSVTVYGSVYKLRRMAELLAPGRDFSWLRNTENELDAAKLPKSKYSRLVTTAAMVEAGLTLIAEAELPPLKPEYISVTRESRAARRRQRGVADRAELNSAVLARNGLMLALVALCPIRLKNLAALSLGTSLTKVGSTWWITVEQEAQSTVAPRSGPFRACSPPPSTATLSITDPS